MKTFNTFYAGFLLTMLASLASTTPLPDKRTDHTVAHSKQVSEVPYYCDESPEAFACTVFCRATNWQYEYCHPEYCESHPEHWSCKPKYIEEEQGDKKHKEPPTAQFMAG